MGAPLDMACRSSLLLRSAQTLSTTLLGFEILQRPQHVLSNLLDRSHASVWTGSSTIAFSSAFPLALSLAFSYVTALCLPIDSGHARQATVKCGRERQEGDRVATGRSKGGDRKTTGQRQESGREATGSDRQATGRRQGRCDRRATGGRQGGDRVATGRRQGSDRKQDIATG